MARCKLCAGLSVSTLLDLAKEEFKGCEFPRRAFYQHHQSFHDLEEAAERGCDFCSLILNEFKGTLTKDDGRPVTWPRNWLGSQCPIDDSMYAVAKELPDSNVRIGINSDAYYSATTLNEVSMLDTLLVQVGPRTIPDEDQDQDADLSDPKYWEAGQYWELPALWLDLSTPQSMMSRFSITARGNE